jgi:hypothetical protein
MTAVRLSRWIIFLAGLVASITWSYVSIHHLLEFSMNQQEQAAEYRDTAHAPSEHLHEMDLAQRRWGRQTMFAVACSIGFLLAVMINWAVDGPSQRGYEELR